MFKFKHMEQISWGIIGCGDVTEIKSGPAFNKVPYSRLAAVMRRNKEKAKDYAIRHGVPKWYSEAIELIQDKEVNAIYIATPPRYHEEYALMAIEAGKPVYLEKPMTLDADSAQRIADAARDAGVKISIAHYRRQQPLFLKVRSLLKENAIGKVQMVQMEMLQPYQTGLVARTEQPWRLDPNISGGGLFHDLAPHQLDLMYYFFDKPLHATGIASNTGGYYTADDTVSGQILFENKVLFSGAWCFVSPLQKKDSCVITGSDGLISFSIFDLLPVVLTTKEKHEQFHFDALPHVQQPMIEQVVNYFLGNAPNPCSADEGMEVMRLIDAFTKKM